MIKFPFFIYFLFSRFLIDLIGEKCREDFRNWLIATFEASVLPTMSLEHQKRSEMYLSILKQISTRNFFVFMRLAKHDDFHVFLYILDGVRGEIESYIKNYNISQKKEGV